MTMQTQSNFTQAFFSAVNSQVLYIYFNLRSTDMAFFGPIPIYRPFMDR